jgi:hypothetical protein
MMGHLQRCSNEPSHDPTPVPRHRLRLDQRAHRIRDRSPDRLSAKHRRRLADSANDSRERAARGPAPRGHPPPGFIDVGHGGVEGQLNPHMLELLQKGKERRSGGKSVRLHWPGRPPVLLRGPCRRAIGQLCRGPPWSAATSHPQGHRRALRSTLGFYERMFFLMAHPSGLTEERLTSLYDGDGFGGEKTMRAKVIRELIDEIRVLRSELLEAERHQDGPPTAR